MEAWVAADKDGTEYIYGKYKPFRDKDCDGVWFTVGEAVHLPKGSIKKLIGRELTWEDGLVELKEE